MFVIYKSEHMRERLVSCIRRKRGQIKGLQDNNKSKVIFVLKREKWYDKLFNAKYLPLFHPSFWKIHEVTSWNEDKFDVVDIIWRTFKAALATILTQKI
jgi:hypothetical protein